MIDLGDSLEHLQSKSTLTLLEIDARSIRIKNQKNIRRLSEAMTHNKEERIGGFQALLELIWPSVVEEVYPKWFLVISHI